MRINDNGFYFKCGSQFKSKQSTTENTFDVVVADR